MSQEYLWDMPAELSWGTTYHGAQRKPDLW
jgi:hypothetical protein